MKNVLILSCSTGQGHNSCAQAVKEYFDKQKSNCEIQDALLFVSKRFAGFMAWGHSFMYRHIPGLFQWGYNCSKNHPMAFKQVFSRILVSGSEAMYEYLLQNKFDTVICTHSFAAIILTHMLKNHPMSIQTAFVVTDYTCYPGMEDVDVQKYFIPSQCLLNNFEKCGIPKERITAVGIPVCRNFFKNIEKEDRRC